MNLFWLNVTPFALPEAVKGPIFCQIRLKIALAEKLLRPKYRLRKNFGFLNLFLTVTVFRQKFSFGHTLMGI